VRFLAAAPHVSCDAGAPGAGRLWWLRLVSVVVVTCYCVPLPFVVGLALYRNRNRSRRAGLVPSLLGSSRSSSSSQLSPPPSPPALSTPGGLPRPVSDSGSDCGDDGDAGSPPLVDRLLLLSLRDPHALWWWPVAYELGRGVALALLVGLVPVQSTLLPVGVFGVLAVSALAHARVRPSRRALDSTLELAVLLCATLAYLVSIIGSRAARRGTDDPAQDSADTLVTAFVSLLTLGMTLALVAALASRRPFSRLLDRRRRRRRDDDSKARPMRAVNSLNEQLLSSDRGEYSLSS
jgi:hypothetical protein